MTNNSRVSDIKLKSVTAEDSENDFCKWLPPEITLCIFCRLDIQSLCRASVTCRDWHKVIGTNDSLWEPHCLALTAVCKREIDDDQKKGYSWKEILQRNYPKSKVKRAWLSGQYSNICSPDDLPEDMLCPMDAEAWGKS